MYHPVPPKRPVTLVAAAGASKRYDSLPEAVAALGIYFIRNYVGTCFREKRRFLDEPYAVTHPYVLRDYEGLPIPVEECEAVAAAGRIPWHYTLRGALRSWNGQGPVPYTGRRHYGKVHRRIRTFGEHRASAAVLREEGEPVFRGARNGHNLPNAWDDLQITSRRDRCWKRHRKTRWR